MVLEKSNLKGKHLYLSYITAFPTKPEDKRRLNLVINLDSISDIGIEKNVDRYTQKQTTSDISTTWKDATLFTEKVKDTNNASDEQTK